MMTANQISELRRLLERYYDCLSSPEEEARLADLLDAPELPEEFAADARLLAEVSSAPVGAEEAVAPADLEERILAATCGAEARKRFGWRRMAAWGAAACVAAVGAGLLFMVSRGGESTQFADNLEADTIIIAERIAEESPAQREVPKFAEVPEEKPAPVARKPRLASAAPKAVAIQQGHICEVTDSIEAERLLAEALALINSAMEEANSSLAVADENMAETKEYLQIVNILPR